MQIIIPISGLLINIVIQLLSLRYIPRLGLLKSEYLGFLAGLISVLALEFYSGGTPVILIANCIIYSSLGYCYFHFVNLGETARRIRILRELYDSKDGLSLDAILKRYHAKEIIEKRISRLINNGQILYKDGRYYIGNKTMLFIAKSMTMLKLIIFSR